MTPPTATTGPISRYPIPAFDDLPDDIREPRLFVGDADPISTFLIGHERSPFHRKVWFGI